MSSQNNMEVASNSPSKKRKVSEVSQEGDQAERQESREPLEIKHGSVWFDDGNVILISENVGFKVSQSRILCEPLVFHAPQVYKGMLSNHSAFFKDMFELPQPADAETIDGCATVKMTDTVREVEVLLRILFQRRVSLRVAAFQVYLRTNIQELFLPCHDGI